MRQLKRFLCLIWLLLGTHVFAVIELDVSLWRLSAAKSSFDERITEGDVSDDLIPTAFVDSGRPVWEIETDSSKYLFDLSYQFDEMFHRIKVGIQYAGTGSSDVKDVSWSNQVQDIFKIFKQRDFSADKMTYTNVYFNYRLLPFETDTVGSNDVRDKGVDLILSYTQLSQDYIMKRISTTRYSDMSGFTTDNDPYVIDVKFTTDSKSLGLGVGGERMIEGTRFGIAGRVIYLPFFDFNGSAWDSELKMVYEIKDWLKFTFGGKWFFLDIEAKQTIQNIAQIPGFSDSQATFKGLNTDLKGYTVGVLFEF